MPPAPGSYNRIQITEMGDDMANRMSREALFLVGGLPEVPDTESGETFDYRDGLDSQAAEAVGEIEREAGRSLECRGVDAGRGAGYLGIAVEVLEPIATVGGASAAVIEAARFVRWAYHKIAKRAGRRPVISLGAAEYLAMADLIDRVGSTPPRVLGSGDMSSHSPDRAFTGGGAFFVVLATESGLHHYHVSAYGEVFFIGISPPIRGHWDDPPPYWAGGGGDED